VRGQSGGYTLNRPAGEIKVGAVLELLGGQLFGPNFCERHAGLQETCAHSVDCSLRVLWGKVQDVLQRMLNETTVEDLLCGEEQMRDLLQCRAGQQTAVGAFEKLA
jgi:Rrf2 family transcriptional regulator, iron-sulfur cluster assembly transcription factor